MDQVRAKYKNKQLKRFNDLVDYILRTNGEICNTDEKIQNSEIAQVNNLSLDSIELSVLDFCFSTKKDNKELLLLTNSSKVLKAANELGVNADKAVFSNLNESWLVDQEIKHILIKLRDTAGQNVIAIIIVVLSTVFQTFQAQYPISFNDIIKKFDLVYIAHYRTFWFVLIPLVGLFLYWLRCKALLVYAVLEIVVGMFLASSTASSMSKDQIHDVFIILKILTSIYIIVRGLDNMGKHFRKAGKDNYWDKVFKEN